MNIWQGDPPRPVLHRSGVGFYEWRPSEGVLYEILDTEDMERDAERWEVFVPGAERPRSFQRLGEARVFIGQHYIDRWGPR